MALTPLDTALSKAVTMRFISSGGSGNSRELNVGFQFPPRIISDSKGGSWEERETRGDEPIAYFKTSKARAIRLEWTYIIGESGGRFGPSGASKVWTNDMVRNMVSGLRGYFHRITASGKGDGLVVYFKMWNHGGQEEMTCRILQFDIAHSKSIVVPDGDVDKAYPLRTNVSCDLRLWTKTGSTGAASGSEDEKMNVEALKSMVPEQWV